MPEDFLLEQLKTIRNLCDIGIILINIGKDEYLATVLETILCEAQEVVDENCILEE